jgi:hypothetical protein
MASGNERRWDFILFLILGVASSVWCMTAAAKIGATFDEPIDVANSLTFWRTGSHYELLRLGAMPLPMDLCSLPLHLWERWQGTAINLREGNQATALWWARMGTLPFWWLLLFYGWRVGSELAGPWGGRLAAALLATEPTFLAHASLATKDIAISACLLALVHYFRVGREGNWKRRVALPGLWFGLALLSKASALVFGPLAMLAVEIERLVRQSSTAEIADDSLAGIKPLARLKQWWFLLQPWRRDVFQAGTLGVLITFIYCGSDWLPERSWVAWAHQLPDGAFARSMVWLSENVKIFNNAGAALVRQITHNLRGHGSFLMGRTDPRYFWYYYPVALSMKLTLSLLLLPLLLAVLRPRALTNWACAAGGVLLLYSLRCNVQIGVRLMLPAVALAVAGLAAALVRAWQETHWAWQRQLLRAAAIGCVTWAGISSIQVWPGALCYTNELWGGTDNGYLCLSDSNYDWGQGLPELAAWQKQRGISSLDVWYFGTDPVLDTLPMSPIHVQEGAGEPAQTMARVRGHFLAVSTTLVYGSYTLNGPSANVTAYLKTLQPVDRTQTFLIYDFSAEPRLEQRVDDERPGATAQHPRS